ncbi:MAG: hypothetical protein WCI74_03520, partial [Actinomycetes bacterium]
MAALRQTRGIATALVATTIAAGLSLATVAGPALAATIDLAPSKTIGGSATDLSGPLGNATDATGNLYVTNYYTGSVTVFDPTTSGNTAPTRTLTGGLTGPAGVALDGSANLYVADMGAATIAVYDHGASGGATPIRAISGSNTGLSGPYGIALD